MKIISLKLNHFGKFHQSEFELKDGINIIRGDNEAGKSTIHAFIGGMLFGLERLRGRAGKDDRYTRYQPWDTPGAYQGSMDFEHNGRSYRLSRVFYQKEKKCTLTELDTGRNIPLADDRITSLIPELTESVYRNTISIEQLHARTDAELADNVRNYIANMTLSKSEEVDVKRAVVALTDKKKKFEQQFAAADIDTLELKLEECREREQEADKLAGRRNELEEALKQVQTKQEKLINSAEYQSIKEAEQYPVFREKYSRFKALSEQHREALKQLEELKEPERYEEIDKDIDICEQKIKQLEELQRNRLAIENEQDLSAEQVKHRPIGNVPFILLAIGVVACIACNNRFVPGIIIGIIIALVGIGLGFRDYLKYREQLKTDEAARQAYRDKRREAAEAEEAFIHSNGTSEELRRKSAELTVLKTTISTTEHRRSSLQKDIREYSKGLEDIANEITVYGSSFVPGSSDVIPDDEYMERLRTETAACIGIVRGKSDSLTAEADNIKRELDRITWELSGYAENEDRLLSLTEQKTEIDGIRQEVKDELAAISLAIDTINELSADIHDSFGRELNKTISASTEKITNGSHKELFVDEQLNTTITAGVAAVSLERFSAGTIDQIYLALRLAVADMFFSNHNIPLIFDDTFAFYDDTRLEAAIQYLSEQQPEQIIIFSCHDREANILRKKGIPYNEIRLGC